MSLSFLNKINGNNNGYFKSFINKFNDDGQPKICWYPSAYKDFKPMLYLSKKHVEKFQIQNGKFELPDLFIHTDINQISHFFSKYILFEEEGATMTIKNKEALDFSSLDMIKVYDSCAFYLEIEINSNTIGLYNVALLYLAVENEIFYRKALLQYNVKVSHLINVRYGSSWAVTGSSGYWILEALSNLNCKYFLTDYSYRFGEKLINLDSESIFENKQIYKTSSELWSDSGDVYWNLLT
jgi:hypothetical protein